MDFASSQVIPLESGMTWASPMTATGKGDFISLMTQMWGHNDTICVLIAFIFMTSYRPFALKEKESLWEGEGEKAGAEEVTRAEEEEASKIGRRKRKLR